jgi:hypothetical protein
MINSFCALFPYRLDSMVRYLDGQAWRSTSRFYLLSDEDIQESISRRSKLLRAVMPGDRCRFTAITLPYTDQPNLQKILDQLKQALQTIGVSRVSVYRASGSEDWQIFIGWSQEIDSSELASVMGNWLKNSDLADLESISFFPGTNALVLPLQPGFAWLDECGHPVNSRKDLSIDQALELFLRDLDAASNDWFCVSNQIIEAKNKADARDNSTATIECEVLPVCEPNHEASSVETYFEVAFKSDRRLLLDFTAEHGTDREVVAVPGEADACSNMHQLSLFSTHTFERGPPLQA